jgi:hypothetical protein
MVVQLVCDQCHKPCSSFRYYHNQKICFNCKLPLNPPQTHRMDPMRRTITNREGGESIIAHGDRFLWHTFKWYVVEFLDQDKDVVVRLEGTADVATLPEMLVGELVEEFNLSTMMWR